jgi:hypothetical protein
MVFAAVGVAGTGKTKTAPTCAVREGLTVKTRKPNRVAAAKRWVKNGKRANHRSMPKMSGKWVGREDETEVVPPPFP